jgi:hypothetical protein
MKKLLFLLFFIPLVSFGQGTIFIGESSYIGTEPVSFEAKSGGDLTVSLAKDDNNKYIVVSIYSRFFANITDKLIIYLDNGKVLISENIHYKDYYDSEALSMYLLTDEDISEIINSNIFSIRYRVTDKYGDYEDSTANNLGAKTWEKDDLLFPTGEREPNTNFSELLKELIDN